MEPTPITDEKDLLLRLRGGSEAAFEAIYHRYKKRLGGNLLRMLKSDALADEALQDLFMKLWESRATIDVEKPIRAYLFRIAENLVMDVYRRAARDKQLKAHLLSIHPDEGHNPTEQALYRKEHRQLLEDAIALLPPQCQQVYRLCKLEGLSYDEVSQRLRISTSTINSHIAKANLFLQKHFATTPLAVAAFTTALLHGI